MGEKSPLPGTNFVRCTWLQEGTKGQHSASMAIPTLMKFNEIFEYTTLCIKPRAIWNGVWATSKLLDPGDIDHCALQSLSKVCYLTKQAKSVDMKNGSTFGFIMITFEIRYCWIFFLKRHWNKRFMAELDFSLSKPEFHKICEIMYEILIEYDG